MPSPESQVFNDGLCLVYSVVNIAPPGKMPVEGLSVKGLLRYAERAVGLNRYTQFMQNDVEVSLVLRMPRKIEVSTQDVVIPADGHQYIVRQVQYPPDVTPGCMDITLERLETEYAKP